MTVTINGTTGIAGTNGSAGTPAVQGEDTNTGIFFPAADTVAVATAGAERLRVDSSGNVGIGTSSPFADTNYRSIDLRGSTGGEVVLGSTSVREATITADGTNGMILNTVNATPLRFYTQGTERARIDSTGSLLMGTTSGYGDSNISSVTSGSRHAGNFENNNIGVYAAMVVRNNATSGTRILIDFRQSTTTVGTITHNGTTTAYNTSSDYRLKENVAPMQNALDTVAQLNPVTYTWKADGSAGQGFIAHELQAVVPDCVTGEKDAVDEAGNPQYQGVDTSFLVATLVKAIQELTARVAQLEAQ